MCETLYDVALSFSGKEREFVRHVKEYLEQKGVFVFMDEDYPITIWGKDLNTTFDCIYSNRAKYYVIFVSKHYVESINTFFEFSAMLKTLYERGTSEILQILLDDTTLSFLPPIGAIKINDYDSIETGKQIIRKLRGEPLDEIFQYLTQYLDKGYNNIHLSNISFCKNGEGIYCYSNSQDSKRCYKIQIQYILINNFEKILIYDSFAESGNAMTFPTAQVYKDNGKVMLLNYGFCCDSYQFEVTSKHILQLINKKISQIG